MSRAATSRARPASRSRMAAAPAWAAGRRGEARGACRARPPPRPAAGRERPQRQPGGRPVHADRQQAGCAMAAGRRRGPGQLHERDHPLLHAGTPRAGDHHHGKAGIDGPVEGPDDLLPVDEAHGSADHIEVALDQHEAVGPAGVDRLVVEGGDLVGVAREPEGVPAAQIGAPVLLQGDEHGESLPAPPSPVPTGPPESVAERIHRAVVPRPPTMPPPGSRGSGPPSLEIPQCVRSR